jgi:hypothetical protein
MAELGENLEPTLELVPMIAFAFETFEVRSESGGGPL